MDPPCKGRLYPDCLISLPPPVSPDPRPDVQEYPQRRFFQNNGDMSEQPAVRRVMISSTALDLPEHRKHARDACERMSMLPLVMEQMPASP